VPTFAPLSFLEEGHTGVALFMVLSGYLFAKIINGKPIIYSAFFWNRFLRLAPLLTLVLAIVFTRWWLSGYPADKILHRFFAGFIKPVWPNGAWSITVEMHFYLFLPLLIAIASRKPQHLLLGVTALLILRAGLYYESLDIRRFAYSTIVGRGDQFLIGMFLAIVSSNWRPQKMLLALVVCVYAMVWQSFNMAGGYYGTKGSFIWVFLPTIEAVGYGLIIALYDRSEIELPRTISKLLAATGAASFSIYLLHLLFVRQFAVYIDRNIIDMSAFPVAVIISTCVFIAFVPFAYLNFRIIEKPFLSFRKAYVRKGSEG
jgi:rhamnosyltransferase